MVQRIGGSRRKSRQNFTKHYRRKGKISITRFFQRFEEGDNVVLLAEPAYQKGLYHARMHGKTGIIEGMQGCCYKVGIRDGHKEKILIVHPVHLKRL